MDSPPGNSLVTRELAGELQRVLDRFAIDASFSQRDPVGVFFKPGVVGHHQVGRAADLYGVGGVGIHEWKRRWDVAMENAGRCRRPEERHAVASRARDCNLGWRLYRALRVYGRWARPPGYPTQLFGPWTRTEGPWKLISDRLLRAHHDHIHIAR